MKYCGADGYSGSLRCFNYVHLKTDYARSNIQYNALSKGPNRVGVSPFTRGRKQIQFSKRCVF
jgi:hypothetical protein